MPVSPSRTSSGTPPTADATTGNPAAIASSTDIGSPSESLESTNRSAAASNSSTSLRVPSSSTAPSNPSLVISAASAVRLGPSPAIRSRAEPGSRAATARTSVVKSFGGRNRPTLTSVTGAPTGDGRRRGFASATPLWITTVRPARQVWARSPARRSLSATQTVIVVSGLIRRSAHRYVLAAIPLCAVKAQP